MIRSKYRQLWNPLTEQWFNTEAVSPDSSEAPEADTARLCYRAGFKQYALSNHLGNVLATVSDRVILEDTTADDTADAHLADLHSAQDFYPFGMRMPGRAGSLYLDTTAQNITFQLESAACSSCVKMEMSYRYGFNGKEDNPEWQGKGNSYDYGFRIYNPRIGKFLSVDPLAASYPWYTPYQFAGNKPIAAIDLDGLEEKIVVRVNNFYLNPQTGRKNNIITSDEVLVNYSHLPEELANSKSREAYHAYMRSQMPFEDTEVYDAMLDLAIRDEARDGTLVILEQNMEFVGLSYSDDFLIEEFWEWGAYHGLRGGFHMVDANATEFQAMFSRKAIDPDGVTTIYDALDFIGLGGWGAKGPSEKMDFNEGYKRLDKLVSTKQKFAKTVLEGAESFKFVGDEYFKRGQVLGDLTLQNEKFANWVVNKASKASSSDPIAGEPSDSIRVGVTDHTTGESYDWTIPAADSTRFDKMTIDELKEYGAEHGE